MPQAANLLGIQWIPVEAVLVLEGYLSPSYGIGVLLDNIWASGMKMLPYILLFMDML